MSEAKFRTPQIQMPKPHIRIARTELHRLLHVGFRLFEAAARLDRLGDAREVAQIGAVLGRDFSYALLSAASTIPPDNPRAIGWSTRTSCSSRAPAARRSIASSTR